MYYTVAFKIRGGLSGLGGYVVQGGFQISHSSGLVWVDVWARVGCHAYHPSILGRYMCQDRASASHLSILGVYVRRDWGQESHTSNLSGNEGQNGVSGSHLYSGRVCGPGWGFRHPTPLFWVGLWARVGGSIPPHYVGLECRPR